MKGLKPESCFWLPEPQSVSVRGPAAHLRRAPDWRRSGDEAHWDSLVSKVEVVPPTSRTPRPQSAIEGGQMNRWLQQLESLQSGQLGGPIRDQVPSFYDRTVSMPTLHNEPVGSSLSHQGLPSLYRRDLSSCGTPSLCESSLGSQESLKAGLCHSLDRRGSRERAHISQVPGKQQAKLCSLSPVRMGWLPIERMAMVSDTPGRHLETPASQVRPGCL